MPTAKVVDLRYSPIHPICVLWEEVPGMLCETSRGWERGRSEDSPRVLNVLAPWFWRMTERREGRDGMKDRECPKLPSRVESGVARC